MTQNKKCSHKWETSGIWGVIIGLSHCEKCCQRSRLSDFPAHKSTVVQMIAGKWH